MRELDNLCAKCWSELTEGSVCGNCEFDNDCQNDSMYLPIKTVLQGKYAVGSVSEIESDAVSYSGFDTHLGKPVIIRELYPKNMANRLEGNLELHVRQRFTEEFEKIKKSFFKLWTTIEKLHNLSAIVPVYDIFEENGTMYAIIEDMDSISLRQYLVRNENGYIPWETARLMFMPVITTISYLHANGIIHGSITPNNLLLCRDGKVRLKPFSIIEASNEKSQLEFSENEGYTAIEQYANNHKIGTATDIYAFAACIYRALVGSNPPSAVSREANDKLMIPNEIAENIPIHVIKALVSGLQIYPEKRIKNIEDFRELLEAAPAVQAKAAPQEDIYQEGAKGGYPDDYERSQKQSGEGKRKAVVIVLVILIVAAIAAAVYVIKYSDLVNRNDDTQITTTQAATHQVPNFTEAGYTQADIENNGAWNKQFQFVFVGEYSADKEEGIVFKQSIAPGETVEERTEITLTISKGIQTEVVPDVGSLNLEEAKKILEEKGFKVSTVEVYNDGTHTANTVKSITGMAPAATSVVAIGEEIILQVYGEEEVTTSQAQPE